MATSPPPHLDTVLVEWLEKRIGDKLKIWAAGLMLAYAVPIVGAAVTAAWWGGALNEKLDNALSAQKINTLALENRGDWIADQERFNCEVRRAIISIDEREAKMIGDCSFINGKYRRSSQR